MRKIVSGGQTGADRAGLDFAIEHGIPHGGWCPKRHKAEDGVIDPRYDLRETSTDRYLQRTEQNMRDSDGTVIFTVGAALIGGSKKTAGFAMIHHCFCLVVDPLDQTECLPQSGGTFTATCRFVSKLLTIADVNVKQSYNIAGNGRIHPSEAIAFRQLASLESCTHRV